LCVRLGRWGEAVQHLRNSLVRAAGLDWYFFFQAEDGIRDATVTGVQTCALPIFGVEQIYAWGTRSLNRGYSFCGRRQGAWGICRSEERRVGKECRSRWWPEQ